MARTPEGSERFKKVLRTYGKYVDNIRKTKTYQSDFMAARNADGNEPRLDRNPQEIMHTRQYSRNTYMGAGVAG